jgi:hypothetical protein
MAGHARNVSAGKTRSMSQSGAHLLMILLCAFVPFLTKGADYEPWS